MPHRVLPASLTLLALSLLMPRDAMAQTTTTTTTPTRAGIGIRLVDGPRSAAGDPRSQAYIVDRVAPGTRIVRHVEVTNATGAPVDLSLYVAGADIVDGSFTARQRDEPSALRSWSDTSPSSVHLPAGAKTIAEVVIVVPNDAPDGEEYGAVFAEHAGERGRQVQINSRVGIRVYLSIGSGRAPVSDFELRSVDAGRDEAGHATVTAHVRNTGERAVDLAGELTLADGPGGVTAGPFVAAVPTTLAPGDEQPVLVTLDADLPLGPWLATITLRSGTLERSAEARIRFPGAIGRVTSATVVARQVDGTTDGDRRRVALPIAAIALALAGGSTATVLAGERAKRVHAMARS